MAKKRGKNTNITIKTDANTISILAIFGIIFAFAMPLVGLILCIIALKKIKESGSSDYKALAKAGLIISIILLALLIGLTIIVIVWQVIKNASGYLILSLI